MFLTPVNFDTGNSIKNLKCPLKKIIYSGHWKKFLKGTRIKWPPRITSLEEEEKKILYTVFHFIISCFFLLRFKNN